MKRPFYQILSVQLLCVTGLFAQNPLSLSHEDSHVVCYGNGSGAINLQVQGGYPPYTYQWSNGASTEDINQLDPGTYTVIVTDAQQQQIAQNITIDGPTQPLEVSGSVNHVSTFGGNNGEINITVSGGSPFKVLSAPYHFEWSNGSINEDINNLFSGIYSVEVTDRNGCVVSTTFHVLQPLTIKKKPQNKSLLIVRQDLISRNIMVYTESEINTFTVLNVESGQSAQYSTQNGILQLNDLLPGIYLFYAESSSGDSESSMVYIK